MEHKQACLVVHESNQRASLSTVHGVFAIASAQFLLLINDLPNDPFSPTWLASLHKLDTSSDE